MFVSPEKFVLLNDPLIAHATHSKLRVVTGTTIRAERGPMLDDWKLDISAVERAAKDMFES